MAHPAVEERPVAAGGDARTLVRWMRQVRPYRRLVVLQLALMAVASGFQVLQPLLVRHVLDVSIPGRDRAGLLLAASAFLGLILAELATRHASLMAMMLTGQGVVRDLRKALFERIQRLDQATFDRTPVGRLSVRATNDVESLEEMFSSGLTAVLGDLFKLVLLLVVMLVIDVRLTLVALALTPLFLGLSLWYRVRIRGAYREVRRRLAGLNAYLQEVLTGIRVVRLFGQEAAEKGRFGSRNGVLLGADQRAVFHDSCYSSIVEMLTAFAVAATIWHGGSEVVRGALTFGTLFAFLQYAQQFFTPLQDLSQRYAVLQSAMASSERVFGLLDTEDRIRSPDPARPVPPPTGAVELRRVTFAYPGGPLVLRDVSFDVAPGRTVALVGATGSGKTTVTRLLSRLHDVARGRPADADPAEVPGGAVLVDGVDVRDLPLDVLRRRVGVVLQDPMLFSGPLRASLFVDDPARDPAAWSALEAVGAAELARRLGGLDGVLQEGGRNLSAGEGQLLTLARALLHDPEILVLDEATASVDTLTERRIQAALTQLLRGRTSVVVAHRLSTVRAADEILVFHRGQVRERGRHVDLLAAGGLYERLHRLQFSGSS